MTHEEYAKHVEEFLIEMDAVTISKNADYSAGQSEAMAGFYEIANIVDISPLQTWFVLAMKHIMAIRRYVKTGIASSETIHGRFIDLANYAMLGDALTKNMRKESKPKYEVSQGDLQESPLLKDVGRTMVSSIEDQHCSICNTLRSQHGACSHQLRQEQLKNETDLLRAQAERV